MMNIIIPALIKNESSVELLQRTIEKIDLQAIEKIIIVTQGKESKKIVFDKSVALSFQGLHTKLLCHNPEKFTCLNYVERLTKWNAIERGLEEVKANDLMVMLLDADDPIETLSFKTIEQKVKSSTVEWMIGRRNEIILYANDQRNKNSRIYLELFTNTLLILKDSLEEQYKRNAPDMQSGIYVVRADLLKSVNLSKIGSYGGELEIFDQLSRKGVVCESIDIVTNASEQSSYSFKEIVYSIFTLELFKDMSDELLEEAKEKAIHLYADYFQRLNKIEYREEVDYILLLKKELGI